MRRSDAAGVAHDQTFPPVAGGIDPRNDNGCPSVALVTAADAGYASLLHGWLASALRLRYAGRWKMHVIDGGLQRDDVARLESFGVDVIPDTMRERLPSGCPGTMSAILLRPILPSLLLGYEYIFWCDADCWFQSPLVIEDYVRAAAAGDAACCAEADTGYDVVTRKEPRERSKALANVRVYRQDRILGWYQRHFASELAYHMSRYPLLNTGVLCAASDSPVWQLWDALLWDRVAAKAGAFFSAQDDMADFLVELLTFNVVVRMTDAVQVSLLPPRLNWLCHLDPPAIDAEQRLCLPTYPFQPLDVIHASGAAKRSPLYMAVLEAGGGRPHTYVERMALCPYPLPGDCATERQPFDRGER